MTPEAAKIISAQIEQEEAELAEMQAAMPVAMPLPMSMMSGSYSNNLHFSNIDQESTTNIKVTISYPASMQGVPLDIVGASALISWDWAVLASTSCPYASSFDYITPNSATTRQFLACYRTDIPSGDSDGDGQTNVSIRWNMGATDAQNNEGGWNIDEVRVLHIW